MRGERREEEGEEREVRGESKEEEGGEQRRGSERGKWDRKKRGREREVKQSADARNVKNLFHYVESRPGM